MTVRALFLIILKVIGLFFLKDFFVAIPQFLSLISMSVNFGSNGVSPLIAAILSIMAYGYIGYLLLFKTASIIDKLNLDKGFEVDAIRLNIHRSTVLAICVIVVGALMFINALSPLIRYIVEYYSTKTNMFYSRPEIDWPYLIMYGAEIIIGLLLVGNQRQIVNFIELRRRNKIESDEEPSE